MRAADGTALRDLTVASPLSKYLLELKGKPPKRITRKDSWALPAYRHLRSCLLVSVTSICCFEEEKSYCSSQTPQINANRFQKLTKKKVPRNSKTRVQISGTKLRRVTQEKHPVEQPGYFLLQPCQYQAGTDADVNQEATGTLWVSLPAL